MIKKFLKYLFYKLFNDEIYNFRIELSKHITSIEKRLHEEWSITIPEMVQKSIDKQSLSIYCDMDRQWYSKIIVIWNFKWERYVRCNDIKIDNYQQLARLVEQIKNDYNNKIKWVYIDDWEKSKDRLRWFTF